MKLLDLFCGAGGCAMGYSRAGFEIVGVDSAPQPRYPFEFIQADWREPLSYLPGLWDANNEGFVIHASPPCQFYSNGAKKWKTTDNHPDLIAEVREALIETEAPWVIENIESARNWLRNPILLCGQMFSLGVFRHRLFESPLLTLSPTHAQHNGKVGDGKYHTVTGHAGGSSKRDGWKGGSTADWRVAMGIDWMTGDELAEAIPPAYTKWIGHQIMQAEAKSQL